MTDNNFDFAEHSHRRRNPMTGDWILVSPHRTKRPWQGQQETSSDIAKPSHDPDCYLCAGNARTSGDKNPHYSSTFVFENDFAAIGKNIPAYESDDPLFTVHAESGTCRVICFSPNHGLTLPEMTEQEINAVVSCWVEQYQDLGEKYQWVQVFENKGAVMGCSNPHPHGQIWAQNHIPSLVQTKAANFSTFFEQYGKNMLAEYVQRELAQQERIVRENEDWLVVVPFWATWPFETLLLPKFNASRMTELTVEQQASLANILKQMTICYDNLFETEFPYSMGWHGAPFDNKAHPEWLLHAHFYPPLLRSASVKKFMVGYEMLGEAQRDLTPEQAAKRLRELPSVHYKQPR